MRTHLKTAVYAGTFDPPTLGHFDIIKRGLQVCDNLVIGIGENSSKKTMFSVSDRKDMLSQMVHDAKSSLAHDSIYVTSFDGLLVEFAKKTAARILIRGIRSVSDFEYEINLANINKTLAPQIETIFLPTSPTLSVVSSSMVKELMKHGADVSQFVPPSVNEFLKK